MNNWKIFLGGVAAGSVIMLFAWMLGSIIYETGFYHGTKERDRIERRYDELFRPDPPPGWLGERPPC